MKLLAHIIFQSTFWLWNLTFLAVVYLGILPIIGIPLITATFRGQIPFDFFLSLVTLIAIPTVTSIIGIRLRRDSVKLIRLFYGVEAPFLLLCLLRLFLIREVTPASGQILATGVICVLAFLIDIVYGYAERSQIKASIQLICHCFMLIVGLWVSALLMFYVVPTVPALIGAFLKFEWLNSLISFFTYSPWEAIWWVPLLFLLFGFSATLFVAMPFVLITLYVQSYRRIVLLFAAQYGISRTYFSAIAVVTAWVIVFTSLQYQPQKEAFKLLENSPANDNARQTLLAKSNVIKEGLVNAYLWSYRYLSPVKENNHIAVMYKNTFGISDNAAKVLQTSYNYLMSPFLYQGSYSDDKKAEKLYAEFFDTPIQKAEQAAIQHALQSTYNQDEAKAGLLNINQKKVFLAEQKVTVKPQGDWAEVELYELYENQTPEDQEVFYSFSLPESTVITGVWLGNTNKISDRYPFIVSPRGAAQKVYNAEVRRQVDPALLEQVGTRHYRLRAFPVPRQTWDNWGDGRLSSQPAPPTKLHLWLTYKVMQQEKGWALPQLGEKRNVFWTNSTQRTVNGQVVNSQTDWLPSFVAANTPLQPRSHQTNFTEGYSISAQPLTNSDYSLPQNKRFAVVLDTSLSMGTQAKAVKQTLAWLQDNGFADNNLANNDADLYVIKPAGAKSQRIDDIRKFDSAKTTFYGTVQLQQMLQQFIELRGDTAYDGILLLTDEGSYELSEDTPEAENPIPVSSRDRRGSQIGSQTTNTPPVKTKKALPVLPAPLWMVHLGEKLPPAYDDATLKAMQDSGGGVSTKITEVMQRIATKEKLGTSAISVVDGYAWYLNKVAESKNDPDGDNASTSTPVNKDGFAQVAARYLVTGLSKERNQDQLAQLDAIHAVAKKFDIVTPYSSMIVLVNDRQKQALQAAEKQSDRFDRKVESGQEQLTKPSNPLAVPSVPEPEEWMLMGIGAVALIFIIRNQRRTS